MTRREASEPRGTSRNTPNPYLNSTGVLTPLFHLEKEAEFHAPTLNDV